MSEIKSGKRGVVLFIVLGMLLIVVALSGVILNIVSSQSRLTHHQVSRIRAYYAGQAGMNLVLENLRNGSWAYNSRYAINCTSANCTSTVPVGNRLVDNDIPYEVIINVGPQGTGGPSGTTAINITTNYTYTP